MTKHCFCDKSNKLYICRIRVKPFADTKSWNSKYIQIIVLQTYSICSRSYCTDIKKRGFHNVVVLFFVVFFNHIRNYPFSLIFLYIAKRLRNTFRKDHNYKTRIHTRQKERREIKQLQWNTTLCHVHTYYLQSIWTSNMLDLQLKRVRKFSYLILSLR